MQEGSGYDEEEDKDSEEVCISDNWLRLCCAPIVPLCCFELTSPLFRVQGSGSGSGSEGGSEADESEKDDDSEADEEEEQPKKAGKRAVPPPKTKAPPPKAPPVFLPPHAARYATVHLLARGVSAGSVD